MKGDDLAEAEVDDQLPPQPWSPLVGELVEGMTSPGAEPPIELASTPKLRRAQALHLQYVNDAEAWAKSGTSVKNRVSLIRAEWEFPPAPEEMVSVIGDCIQNMRSALDHEVYRIARDRHGASWGGLSAAAFPLVDEPRVFEARGARDQIRGLSEEERAFIRSVQRFARPRDRASTLLYLVNRLARVDRHRTLHLAAMQPTSVTYDAPQRGLVLPGLPVMLNCEIRFVDTELGLTSNVHQVLGNGLISVADTISRLRRVAGNG
jgi:hypothetical protein